ncbi:YciI family protein [Cellulomonas sp. KRMCY2]|uniref:YciI family protein n=1 Tax=Cellulomonas sp. KRMCY2 TaxID=1304865 RepID=UPI00045E98E2|nr:YciI family protein [Cellulomonas sp. KRMCY2]
MKYMLLMSYGPIEGVEPIDTWSPQDIAAHIAFMGQLGQDLTERGELVDAQGLSGPEAAKIVTSTGVGAPVVTDGPFPESKEFLAGYWVVDVDDEARALEIAATTSAAPGPGGVPLGQQIEVRPIMDAPAPEM